MLPHSFGNVGTMSIFQPRLHSAAATSLQKPESLQFGCHFRRHVGSVARRKVGRDTLLLEVAPALEGLAGARRGRHQGTLDLDSTEFLAVVLVEILLEADQCLAAADNAAHDPVKRTAGQQLGRPSRHISGIDPMRGSRTLPALLAPRRLDFLHVGEVVHADRQLDQMQRHRWRLVRAASPLKRRLSTARRMAWYARNSGEDSQLIRQTPQCLHNLKYSVRRFVRGYS